MAITLTSNITTLVDNLVDVVVQRSLSRPMEKYYPMICTEKTLSTPTGTYQQIGQLGPAAVKPEGDNMEIDKIEDAYTTEITVQTIAKAAGTSFESLQDDQYNVVNQVFGPVLIDKLVQFKERAIADLYNDSFSTTGADGVYEIDDDHPLVNSALENDNLATGSLTVENLKAAYNKFNFIYDQSGEYMNSRPTHLLTHPNKMFQIIELMESNLLAHELSNTKNSLMDLRIKPVFNPYIDYTAATDVAPWFLLDRNLPDSGAVLQRQTGYEIQKWTNEENMTYYASVAERYGTGMIAPGYGVVGSDGTD